MHINARDMPASKAFCFIIEYPPYMFDAVNSDTHTLRIEYEYTQKLCVGVAIEGIDIWYMGFTTCNIWID